MKWSNIKKKLPRVHAYQHTCGISFTPHIGYQWYKYQGRTSDGCLKAQFQIGWLIWTIQFIWEHPKKDPVRIITEFEITEVSMMPDGSFGVGGVIKGEK